VTHVCCVKVGDKFGDEYPIRLMNGVRRHWKGPLDFVCYTDSPVDGVPCAPLLAEYPGWWSKINLFGFRRPLVYFDLDVVITGDLTPLKEIDQFTIIKDWWLPGYNSSVMVLTGNEHRVWSRFKLEDRHKYNFGDQGFIHSVIPDANTFAPELFPSYKANDCRQAIPEGAMAVVMHGNPKPDQCDGWVKQHWV
jgi:hypothetical protein